MSSDFQFTEIVELPTVRLNGLEKLIDPDMLKLDDVQLKQAAAVMGGELVYKKVRRTYTPTEQELCNKRSCYRPSVKGTYYCSDHLNS